MNTTSIQQLSSVEKTDFIEILSAEFTCAKGFGVYAFLTCSDIERLYVRFLDETISATVFVRLYVKRFG